MVQNRKKLEETLKMDYKNIDKQFKDQLIKTKVGFTLCFHLPMPRTRSTISPETTPSRPLNQERSPHSVPL